MRRVYTGCPVVRSEDVAFRVPQPGGGSKIQQHRVVWVRQSVADTDLRSTRRGGATTRSSTSSDKCELFEGVRSSISAVQQTTRGWGVYLDRINQGQYGLVVSATVRDVPYLVDDRSNRQWTSMDELLPSYNAIPEDWTLGTARSRRKVPTAPLQPIEVLERRAVWSTLARPEENAAAMDRLLALDPAAQPAPVYAGRNLEQHEQNEDAGLAMGM